MSTQNQELVKIITQFSESGWDLIEAPSKEWLANSGNKAATAKLIAAVETADKECGSCGCDMDALYKKALKILQTA